jgi:murein DD-endopeptidase MepM/ murein hydrolase activator NlpD
MGAAALAVACLLLAPASARAGSERVAALRVALRAHGMYAGTVDGVAGPGTALGVRRLQARAGLLVDGIAGPRTRRALGALGRHPVGSRPLRLGMTGFDVAALQFALETHGFPCGTVDGGFGWHTDAAVRRAQAFYGLTADGVAGPATLAALRNPPVRWTARILRPIAAPAGDRYGPRGAGFHPGGDFPAATGTPVHAAASGRVVFAGYDDGYGLTVVVDSGYGLRTRYAHLSSAAVSLRRYVPAGTLVGRVGATGFATGPHLHFEVSIRGAAADPAPALGL